MESALSDLWHFYKPFLKPYKKGFATLLLFPAVWCLVETLAPFLIKMMIDRLANHPTADVLTQKTLLAIVLAYSSLILILEIATRSCNYVWIKTYPKVRADIQGQALTLIQKQDYAFFYNQLTGSLISRYRNLTSGFENLFKSFLYGFYPTILSFLFSLIFITLINTVFALIFLVWFSAMVLTTLFYFKKSTLASQEQAKSQNRILGYISDFLTNVIVMMAYPRDLSQEKDFVNLKNEEMI